MMPPPQHIYVPHHVVQSTAGAPLTTSSSEPAVNAGVCVEGWKEKLALKFGYVLCNRLDRALSSDDSSQEDGDGGYRSRRRHHRKSKKPKQQGWFAWVNFNVLIIVLLMVLLTVVVAMMVKANYTHQTRHQQGRLP